jgi:hypothetical protein
MILGPRQQWPEENKPELVIFSLSEVVALSRRQLGSNLPDMRHIASRRGSHCWRFERLDCDGASVQADEFHFVRGAAPIDVHDDAHVAGHEARCGEVFRKHYRIVFSNH